jgi:DNA polymerase-1
MDLLVDADILACQFAYAYEARRGGGGTRAIVDADMMDPEAQDDWLRTDGRWAIAGFDSAVERMLRETRTDKAILCFTGSENFRYAILPTYKANRRGQPRPVLLDALIDHAQQAWECRSEDSLEADDVMGIMATKSPRRYVMASTDKDLKQVPGVHYNWRTGCMERVTTPDADYWFYFQVLTGDSTDNYSGCPGVGPRRAKTVLDSTDADPWALIVAAFESKGLSEEDALTQARMARILRCIDYDFEQRRPILWRPSCARERLLEDSIQSARSIMPGQ